MGRWTVKQCAGHMLNGKLKMWGLVILKIVLEVGKSRSASMSREEGSNPRRMRWSGDGSLMLSYQ